MSNHASPPSLDLFAHSPSHIPLLSFLPLPFSIIVTMRNKRVAVCIELNCAIQVDNHSDIF